MTQVGSVWGMFWFQTKSENNNPYQINKVYGCTLLINIVCLNQHRKLSVKQYFIL